MANALNLLLAPANSLSGVSAPDIDVEKKDYLAQLPVAPEVGAKVPESPGLQRFGQEFDGLLRQAQIPRREGSIATTEPVQQEASGLGPALPEPSPFIGEDPFFSAPAVLLTNAEAFNLTPTDGNQLPTWGDKLPQESFIHAASGSIPLVTIAKQTDELQLESERVRPQPHILSEQVNDLLAASQAVASISTELDTESIPAMDPVFADLAFLPETEAPDSPIPELSLAPVQLTEEIVEETQIKTESELAVTAAPLSEEQHGSIPATPSLEIDSQVSPQQNSRQGAVQSQRPEQPEHIEQQTQTLTQAVQLPEQKHSLEIAESVAKQGQVPQLADPVVVKGERRLEDSNLARFRVMQGHSQNQGLNLDQETGLVAERIEIQGRPVAAAVNATMNSLPTSTDAMANAAVDSVTQNSPATVNSQAIQAQLQRTDATGREALEQNGVRGELPRFNVSFNQPGWNETMGRQLTMMVSKSMEAAQIQLDPPELGPLQVRIQVQNDQVSLQFTSQNSMVREALEQSAARIQELLSEEGMDLIDVNVSDRDSNAEQERGAVTEGDSEQLAETEDDEVLTQSTSINVDDGKIDYFI